MTNQPVTKGAAGTGIREREIRVLLVDDQAMVGEAVRRMLAPEADIRFHYCQDPAKALQTATEVQPTVVLQDLVMPDVDGLTLVKFYRAQASTKDVPLIVLSTKEEATTKAEAFARGANDYLVKLPDRIELVARIRYHSRGYINLLQRNEVYEALLASQKALAAELAEASAYVQSLLPAMWTDGPVRTLWKFIPSTQLGGDAFGYHWIDEDHLSLYLLDVCGHGVGAALLSITAMNVLRTQSIVGADPRLPDATLAALNEAFLMERHNNMYFTIWYGVYRKSTRTLRYASAGHPAALLLTRKSDAAGGVEARELAARGAVLGAMSGMSYPVASVEVPVGATLFVLSDGVYEIARPDGSTWTYEEFSELVAKAHAESRSEIEALKDFVYSLHGQGPLDDDFSIVRFEFV